MILDAIGALEDDKVSNESAILGYIKGKHGASLPRKHVSLVRSNLARMVCSLHRRARPEPAEQLLPARSPSSRRCQCRACRAAA